MSATAMIPTMRVPTSATTWRNRRMNLMPPSRTPSPDPPGPSSSERLPDAEVEAEPPRLRLAVHEEAGDWIELVTDIDADRTDRRRVPQTGTDVVAQIAH